MPFNAMNENRSDVRIRVAYIQRQARRTGIIQCEH